MEMFKRKWKLLFRIWGFRVLPLSALPLLVLCLFLYHLLAILAPFSVYKFEVELRI